MPSTLPPQSARNIWQIFSVFLRLGCTSFGGPVAHLAYFRIEFVERRKWLDEQGYADLMALCQFLPGPASSQIGMAIGLQRGGHTGALAAWLGFTLPSALLMTLVALGAQHYGEILPAGLIPGLKLVAVAVVAHAVWGMAKTLCPATRHIGIMLASTLALLLFPGHWTQLLIILAAAAGGIILFQQPSTCQPASRSKVISGSAVAALSLCFGLLGVLPLLAGTGVAELALFDAFYRAGALVFGGGHVVLPLLQTELVTPGWINQEQFIAGYAAAQAVPGPLFTFSAYLGAAAEIGPGGLAGAALCLTGIFLPSALLVAGVMPYWDRLRNKTTVRAALTGINAAVVGLLLATLYQPIWQQSVTGPLEFALALAGFLALQIWKAPSWLLVLAGALAGTVLLPG